MGEATNKQANKQISKQYNYVLAVVMIATVRSTQHQQLQCWRGEDSNYYASYSRTLIARRQPVML